MSATRYVFFTRADEAAFCRELKAKYPEVLFMNYHGFKEAKVELLLSIDASLEDWVYFFIPAPGWQPELSIWPRSNKYLVSNLPGLCGSLRRSGGVWNPDNLRQCYEPRAVGQGDLHIHYDNSPSKEVVRFRNAVWRILPKIATWRMKLYNINPRIDLHTETDDKMYWAGSMPSGGPGEIRFACSAV